MYKIVFGAYTPEKPAESHLFNVVYSAFLGVVNNPNRAANIEETRAAVLVLDAIDQITDLSGENTPQESRALKPLGGALILGDRALALLKRTTDAYVTTAQLAIARIAIQAKDRVDGAQPYTPPPVVVSPAEIPTEAAN